MQLRYGKAIPSEGSRQRLLFVLDKHARKGDREGFLDSLLGYLGYFVPVCPSAEDIFAELGEAIEGRYGDRVDLPSRVVDLVTDHGSGLRKRIGFRASAAHLIGRVARKMGYWHHAYSYSWGFVQDEGEAGGGMSPRCPHPSDRGGLGVQLRSGKAIPSTHVSQRRMHFPSAGAKWTEPSSPSLTEGDHEAAQWIICRDRHGVDTVNSSENPLRNYGGLFGSHPCL